MPKQFHCILCQKRTSAKDRRHISDNNLNYLVNVLNKVVSKEVDCICNKCHHVCTKSSKKVRQSSVPSLCDDTDYHQPTEPVLSKTVSSPPSVSLPIPAAPTSHSRCILCKKPGPKLVVIQSDVRFWVFMEHNIIIKSGSRCCPGHFNADGHLDVTLLKDINLSDTSLLNRSTIHNLMQSMRHHYLLQSDSSINFDNINDHDCLQLTSLHKDQFEDLCSHIMDKVKATLDIRLNQVWYQYLESNWQKSEFYFQRIYMSCYHSNHYSN